MTPLGDVWTFIAGKPATMDTVVKVLTDEGIEGATLVTAVRLWHHKAELSVVIRIAGLNTVTATALARILRREFRLEAVYFEVGGKAWLEYGHAEHILEPTRILQ